ncbi:dTDP-6-deoxy-L-talose 4-dehydrogenase (NAD(+)) [compost metagenome]
MKVLVTGAGGYMGSHVVNQLLNMGVTVIANDFNLERVDSRAQKVAMDIFSEDDIFSKLGEPDVCLHLAWKDGFIHNSNAHMENLSKHYNFIKNMTDSGLKQIAVMGSMHEVGYHVGAIDENVPCNPVSMYGIAKDALRRSIFLLLKDREVTVQWLRAYYIYGDDKHSSSIFAKIIRAEEEGQREFPFTTGKNKYDFIHVNDLAYMIASCTVQNKIDGIINCCTGEPVSLADKVESFIQEHKFNIRLKYGAFPDRPYDSPEVWGDNTKIKRILSEQKLHNRNAKGEDCFE